MVGIYDGVGDLLQKWEGETRSIAMAFGRLMVLGSYGCGMIPLGLLWDAATWYQGGCSL